MQKAGLTFFKTYFLAKPDEKIKVNQGLGKCQKFLSDPGVLTLLSTSSWSLTIVTRVSEKMTSKFNMADVNAAYFKVQGDPEYLILF